MSMKKNILANYVSQFYAAVLGVLMVPMYIRYMGAEAYGLVGFFVMIQTWFQLLDMGLTQTLARETAKFSKGSQSDTNRLRHLLRTMELIFAMIACCGCAVMVAGSDFIVESWLNIQRLPLKDVQVAVSLMAFNIGLRLVAGIYRSVITGFERLVWLSGLNILVTTARFLLILPFFIFVGTTPTDFFSYQLVVSVIELAMLVGFTYHLLPKRQDRTVFRWESIELRSLVEFSFSVAFSNLILVAVMQSDKLLMSKFLTLESYAYFSIATMLANGIFMLNTPISGPLLPRLTRLVAQGSDVAFVALYREATQLVGVVVIPASLVMSAFAEQVLWVWTGDAVIAREFAPVLSLYSLGNAFVALGLFPYYLQYAKGNLRLHVLATFFQLIVLLPAIIYGAVRYGAVGAGYAWFGVNGMFFLFWTAKVHGRFEPGLHWKWLFGDVGVIALGDIATILLLKQFLGWPAGRVTGVIYIFTLSIAMLAISAALSSQIRAKMFARWNGSRRNEQ